MMGSPFGPGMLSKDLTDGVEICVFGFSGNVNGVRNWSILPSIVSNGHC